jgi:hypothetical protein
MGKHDMGCGHTLQNIEVKFNKKECGQCHNCKHNIKLDEIAERWYSTMTIPHIPNTIINPEVKCDSLERYDMFDDPDESHFKLQGSVWILPLEYIDDTATCPYFKQ